MVAIMNLTPHGAAAYTLHHSTPQSALRPNDTPTPGPPALSITPSSGPVGTLVTLQGSGWPPNAQIILRYDDVPTCDSPNLQEIPSDPKPQVSAAGSFSAPFPWPKVSQKGTWYACAATSDGAVFDATPFQVASLNPPSITISPSDHLMPGQTISVQGQNWFPGGLPIAFELRSSDGKTIISLTEVTYSLINGTLAPVTIHLPANLSAGNYVLLASGEQQALQAQSPPFNVNANPTPTPDSSPSPTPMPSPSVTITSTPPASVRPPTNPSHPQISGTLLALILISGGMALVFALIGAALLVYLLRTRPGAQPALELDSSGDTEEIDL
jgi:hypothetical protein